MKDIESAIARCDREIAEMLNQDPGAPAYLTTLGILALGGGAAYTPPDER